MSPPHLIIIFNTIPMSLLSIIEAGLSILDILYIIFFWSKLWSPNGTKWRRIGYVLLIITSYLWVFQFWQSADLASWVTYGKTEAIIGPIGVIVIFEVYEFFLRRQKQELTTNKKV